MEAFHLDLQDQTIYIERKPKIREDCDIPTGIHSHSHLSEPNVQNHIEIMSLCQSNTLVKIQITTILAKKF